MPELKRLGKYEIRRELGKGAMGVVYEGFDPFIDRAVAIKTVDKSRLDSAVAQDMLSRFRREAQASGRLTHPNIVSVYEYGEDQDMAYIAMELIHGKELKAYFDSDERFPIRDVVRIMSQLLKALEYSHNRGVVHRDIKPSNIIIDEEGQVKVADFGIAKIEPYHLTLDGAVIGTPSYMSPEQIMGLAAVDRRTDIYSCGVILYQFLTGLRPFTGSVVAIMHKALNQDPVPPSVIDSRISGTLDSVVKMAMARNPECRFQTALEFDEALRSATGDSHMTGTEIADHIEATAGAVPAAIDEAAGKAAEKNHDEPDDDFTLMDIPSAQAAKASVGRNSQAIAISAGLALILVAVGAWFAMQPSRSPVDTIETPSSITQPQASVPSIRHQAPARTENHSEPGLGIMPETADKHEPSSLLTDLKYMTGKPAAEEPAARETAAEEPAAEKTAAEEPAAEEPAAKEPAAKETSVEEPAAKEPAVEKPAAEEIAAEKTAEDKGDYDPHELYRQGLRYEDQGKLADAMKAFQAAAKGGHGHAMKKLGDIYGKGNGVVPRDYATSVKWYQMAKQSGIAMDKSDLER